MGTAEGPPEGGMGAMAEATGTLCRCSHLVVAMAPLGLCILNKAVQVVQSSASSSEAQRAALNLWQKAPSQ